LLLNGKSDENTGSFEVKIKIGWQNGMNI
jgi:hypothetical protein